MFKIYNFQYTVKLNHYLLYENIKKWLSQNDDKMHIHHTVPPKENKNLFTINFYDFVPEIKISKRKLYVLSFFIILEPLKNTKYITLYNGNTCYDKAISTNFWHIENNLAQSYQINMMTENIILNDCFSQY